MRLPDPNPALTAEEARGIFALTYPEITTAALEGPEAIEGRMRFTFQRAVGSKG
jgi:PRTRC genetic system protein C